MIRGILLVGLLLSPCIPALAASKRVYVYPISQQYWDVRPGETLAGIVETLLPGTQQYRQRLMDDILRLNPSAFIDQNPNRLLANTRLWLPNSVTRPVSAAQDSEIQEFDWGYIKRPQ
jgi:Tfp pilus assembly protein FimV